MEDVPEEEFGVGVHPSSISLRRLMLGAALVLFGFLLSSSTTASADDLGLTKTLDKLVSTATDVQPILDPARVPTAIVQQPVEKVVAAVKPSETVTAVVQPVDAIVEAPLKVVDPPLTRPVKAVVAATTSTVSKSTTVVTTTTSAVSRTLKPLLTGGEDVVDPVVEVVDAIVPVAAQPSSAGLPDVLEPAQGVAPTAALPVTEQAPGPAASVVDRARTERAIRAERALPPTLALQPSAVAPWPGFGINTGSADVTARANPSRTPVHQPAAPAPEHLPTPALPAGGAAQGSGAHGSSAPVGGDLAVTPATFTLAETSSGALRARMFHPRPGPVADPGSRPD